MPTAKFLDSRNGGPEWVECDIITSTDSFYTISYRDKNGIKITHPIDKALVKLPSFSELIT